jgi:hypothetical protein
LARPTNEALAEQERLRQLVEAKEALVELTRLSRERARRRVHEAIKYYTPHPKQDAFHRGKESIRLVLGGNRSGKTQVGCSEDYAHAKGERPWLPEDDPDRKIPIRVPNKGLVVGESFGEQVTKVLVPKFLGDPDRGVPGVIPKSDIEFTKKNPQGVITMIMLKNGSSITFQSYDQADDLFESTDYDWAHLDEPPPRPIWVAIRRGMVDRGGRVWFTMTPLKEPWINDELVKRPDVGKYHFDMHDNVGFGLKAEEVEKYASFLTEEEKETRIKGRFFHLTGLVYKTYSSIHRVRRMGVWKDGVIPANWNLWMHIDTHPRTPHHAIWVAIAPNNIAYVCGAIQCDHPTNSIERMVEQIFDYEKRFLGHVGHVERIIDASAQINNPVTGTSIFDEFWERDIRCRVGIKDPNGGILLVQNRLHFDEEAKVFPTLYFMDDLTGVHDELQRYVWDDWTKRTGQLRTEKQIPRDKDDHYIEGMHRIFLANPQYELPSELDSGDSDEYTAQEAGEFFVP